MAGKEIRFHEDARAALKAGVDALANAVKITMGPRGRNVLIEKSWGAPTSTKDGVTVAKAIEIQDKFENLWAQMVKEVASKTSDVAGDGTTTATVLAQAIFTQGLKLVAAGANPMEVKRGIDKAVVVVTDFLKDLSIQIEERSQIAAVATIYANNDRNIGEKISEAMERVGKDGVLTVEESRGMDAYH